MPSETNIYEAPRANTDVADAGYSTKTRHRFLLVNVAFLINAVTGLATILSNNELEPGTTLYLALAWMTTTLLYGISCGIYLSELGRLRWLWAVPIVVFQPLGIIISYPLIVYRGYRHNWYRQPEQ